jgi:hypothetical protein
MSKMQRASSNVPLNGEKVSTAKTGSTLERRVATPRADLVVVKIGDGHKKSTISSKEKAPVVVARVVRVLNTPGTDRNRIFRSTSGKTVYAYSIDSRDTSKVVREDVSGQRTVGRLVSGKFRAMTSAKSI